LGATKQTEWAWTLGEQRNKGGCLYCRAETRGQVDIEAFLLSEHVVEMLADESCVS
jgi:hypothetical protein